MPLLHSVSAFLRCDSRHFYYAIYRLHVLISWLALLLVRIAEVRTQETWSSLRKELDRIHLGHFSSKNGDVYQSTQLTQEQRKIFDLLGVETPPRFLEIQAKS